MIPLGTLPGTSYAGPSAGFQFCTKRATRGSVYISVYTAELAPT
jgi:hypothetical protein